MSPPTSADKERDTMQVDDRVEQRTSSSKSRHKQSSSASRKSSHASGKDRGSSHASGKDRGKSTKKVYKRS